MVSYKNCSIILYNFLNDLLKIPCCVYDNELEDIEYPYLTYTLPYGSYGNSELSTIFVRSNDDKLTTCVEIVDKLSETIGQGYKLSTDNGYIVLRKGEPFAQVIDEGIGINIKTIYVNLVIEFY